MDGCAALETATPLDYAKVIAAEPVLEAAAAVLDGAVEAEGRQDLMHTLAAEAEGRRKLAHTLAAEADARRGLVHILAAEAHGSRALAHTLAAAVVQRVAKVARWDLAHTLALVAAVAHTLALVAAVVHMHALVAAAVETGPENVEASAVVTEDGHMLAAAERERTAVDVAETAVAVAAMVMAAGQPRPAHTHHDVAAVVLATDCIATAAAVRAEWRLGPGYTLAAAAALEPESA